MADLNVTRLREHWEEDPSIAQGFEERAPRLRAAVQEVDVPRGYSGLSGGSPIDTGDALRRLKRQRAEEINEEILDLMLAWTLGLERL